MTSLSRCWPALTVLTFGSLVPMVMAAQPAEGAPGVVPCTPEGDHVAIRGVVSDTRTSVPIEGAGVRITWSVRGEQEPRLVEVQTGPEGKFAACALPASSVLQTVATFWDASSSRVQTDAMEAGEVREIELHLPAPSADLSGSVVQDGTEAPIAGATLSLGYSSLTAVTSADGSFTIPQAPVGRYELQVDHLAFIAVKDSIEVSFGDRIVLMVRMSSETIVLEPIVVDARSILLEESGFYHREERGYGAYLRRSDIQQRNPLYPSDALRGIAGVRGIPRRDGPGTVLVDRNQCAYRYVFNGVMVGESFQIDDIPADWLEAVEIYRGISTLPAEFQGAGIGARGNCGVIVIWTRNIP